jgi:hypothetical protein
MECGPDTWILSLELLEETHFRASCECQTIGLFFWTWSLPGRYVAGHDQLEHMPLSLGPIWWGVGLCGQPCPTLLSSTEPGSWSSLN